MKIFLTPEQKAYYEKLLNIKPNMERISVVIPLGSGSLNNNLELMYSLRSIQKHCKYVKNVIIVGEPDPFLNVAEAIHIYAKDYARKQTNIRRKIEIAMQHPDCTDNFMVTNDDIFFLHHCCINSFPYYYKGYLYKVREKGARPTEARLKALGKPIKQFDIHLPIVYNKYKFIEAMSAFDWEENDYIIKSAYCNYHEIEGQELKDLKINTSLRYDRIKEEIGGRPCFSVGDHGLNQDMKRLLSELYPERSKYEHLNKAA